MTEPSHSGAETPPGALHALFRIPEEPRDGAPLVVLLHGRGSDERDLLSLAPYLPAAALVASVRAPFPGPPWGYGPGWAWYRYLGGTRVDLDTLAHSLEALDAFMDRLPAALPVRPGPVVIGGFSQGGTTSLAWALSRPGRATGVAMLSGFLVEGPLGAGALAGARDLPVFWGHGRTDPNIAFAWGEAARSALREAGAPMTTFDHAGGHTITSEELEALSRWIDALPRTDKGRADP